MKEIKEEKNGKTIIRYEERREPEQNSEFVEMWGFGLNAEDCQYEYSIDTQPSNLESISQF